MRPFADTKQAIMGKYRTLVIRRLFVILQANFATLSRFKWFNATARGSRVVQCDCTAVQNSPLGPQGRLRSKAEQ